MSKTYTYTARNSTDPAQIVTFTLHSRHLAIEPGPLSQVESLQHSTSTPAAHGLEALTVLQASKTPVIHLIDTAAHVDRDSLRLMAWGRTNDRRWVPITLMLEHVDNLPAARAFVKELNRRKLSALRRERIRGWFSPRIYWFAGGLVAAVFAALTLRSKPGA